MSQLEPVQNGKHPRAAPVEFAGQWVAWNKERTKIVASGSDWVSVRDAAVKAGYPGVVLQHVRHPGRSFIGST